MMGRRVAAHRAPSQGGLVSLVSLGAVAAGLGVIAWLAISWMFSGGDPEPAVEPTAEPAPSVSTPWTWPTQTLEPTEAVVPGEGTFPDPAEVDRTNPDEVAEAAARSLGSHDTLTDSDYSDSESRARGLYAEELPGLGETDRSSADASWLDAQEHEAYSTPLVSPVPVPVHEYHAMSGHEAEHDEHEQWLGTPAVSATGEEVLAYQYRVLLNWTGRDGWESNPNAPQVRVVKLALAERDGQWVVVERYYGEPDVTDYAVK